MTDENRGHDLRLFLMAGFLACFAYPLGIFAPLPAQLRVLPLAAFGPLLGLGCYGLMRILTLRRRSTVAVLGAASCAIAGALFSAMILVQLAAGYRGEDRLAQSVWSGLDVAWDIYIGIGTAFFAAAAYRHEWYGRTIGGSGLAIAFILLTLNLTTFPTPPANAGWFDAGPLVGLWYFAITIASWLALKRLDRARRDSEVPTERKMFVESPSPRSVPRPIHSP